MISEAGIAGRGTPHQPGWLWLLPTMVVVISVVVIGVVAETLANSQYEIQLRAKVQETGSAVRSRIERILNNTLLMARSLETVVILNPKLSQEDFEVVARRLVKQDGRLRNIALAPNLIIRNVYPLEGNTGALGLNYLTNTAQRKDALRARDSGRFVITGPVELVQGGEGFIGRLPVFLDTEDRINSFWGLINTVIDAETFYRDSGLQDSDLGLDIALRALDSNGRPREVFLGSASLFSAPDAQIARIKLPTSAWEMAARAKPGHTFDLPEIWPRRILTIVLGTLVIGMVFLASQWFRERAGSSLRISRLQAILDAAINQSQAGVIIVDFPEETIRMINAAAKNALATGSVNINVGAPLSVLEDGLDRYDAVDRHPLQPALRIALDTDLPVVNQDTIIRLPDGSTRILLVNASPLHDNMGNKTGAISIFSDITELKQEQEARQRLETRLHNAIQSINSGFALWDQDDRLQLVNDGFLEIHKDLRDRIKTGMTFHEFLHEALNQYRQGNPQEDLQQYLDKRTEQHRRLGKEESHRFDWRAGDRWLSIHERRSNDGWISALYVDLTERVEHEKRLKAAQEASEQANQAKTVFLANMTHELRTPLNSILLTSEMMTNQLFGTLNDQYLEYAQIIHGSGKHLLALISDILDMAKIEAGEMNLDVTRFSIGELIDECRLMMELRARENSLTISTDLEGDSVVEADRLRIKQTLLNLLANAIKFSRDGEVRIRLHHAWNDSLILDVIDQGIGMDQDQIEVAFQMFGQVEGSYKNRRFEGTGLGLPIARQLMELHGGSLELISSPGEGTTARMCLPSHRILRADGRNVTSSQ